MNDFRRFTILKKRRREALMLIGFAAAAILIVYLAGNFGGTPPNTGQTVTGSRAESPGNASSPPQASENENIAAEEAAKLEKPDLSHWQVDQEGWLYTNSDGKTYSSVWETVDGQLYYFKKNGRFATGWSVIEGATYLFDPAGRMIRDMWTSSPDGKLYRLSADGPAVTGWYTESDGRVFHMASDGSVQYGWQDIDGSRYYLGGDGVLVTGYQEIDGNHYYFTESGKMHTGWIDLADGTHYFYDDGTMAVGLVTLGEKMFAFTVDGAMLYGMQTFNGAHYYFGDDGSLVTGWVTAEDGQHYFDAPGSEYIGWHYYNDGWHYFSQSGVLDESKKYSDSPAVALTFDDGPGEYTNAILDLLDQYHVKATFFMIGMEVESYTEAVRREHDMGMEQGNHSWDHKTLTHLTAPDIAKEITMTNDVIKSITGDNPTVFRPPGGGTNETVQATSQGLPLILWNIDTLDWQTRDAQSTYDAVMNNVGDGDIILMHEIYEASYQAAVMIIPDLLRRGFQIVTVSELARLKGVDMKPGSIYSYF